jgi:glutathione S-transferase
MYTLYIGNKNYSSWSLRPWVLMRELGVPFEESLQPFDQGSNFETFRNFSPSGRVPCLHDQGARIWDSLGIAEYLAERHEGVWPTDAQARAWARCAAAEMHSGFSVLRNECPMSCGIRVRLDEPSPALSRDIARIDELWSEGLTRFGGPFLAGSRFGAVDSFYAPVAFRVRTYDLPLSPESRAYAERLLNLPSMRDWNAAALQESWRDDAHEAEARAIGTWIEDLRAV